MRRFLIGAVALTAFAVAVVVLWGSFGGQEKDSDRSEGKSEDRETLVKKLVTLRGDSLDGVIEGFVEYDGAPPKRRVLDAIRQAGVEHFRHAPEEQQIDQTWLVDPHTGRVANVLIVLQPPKDHYFPFDKTIDFAKEVVIEAPFCAFVPHVSVIYPLFWDGERHV